MHIIWRVPHAGHVAPVWSAPPFDVEACTTMHNVVTEWQGRVRPSSRTSIKAGRPCEAPSIDQLIAAARPRQRRHVRPSFPSHTLPGTWSTDACFARYSHYLWTPGVLGCSPKP
jgi:hypothetical protein